MRRDGSIATDSGRAPWAPSSLVLHVAEVTCCVHVRIERVLSERKPRERCVLWVYKSLGRVDGAFSRSFSFFFFFFLKYFLFFDRNIFDQASSKIDRVSGVARVSRTGVSGDAYDKPRIVGLALLVGISSTLLASVPLRAIDECYSVWHLAGF